MPDRDRFDYEAAREDMWDAGLDPDDLPESSPEKRDAYLRRVKMDPNRYKPLKKYRPGDNNGTSSGTSGCFLTTACVEAKGLPDDCDELTTLRAFRDGYLLAQINGTEEIVKYYEIAPQIVAAINQRLDAGNIWESIYSQVIIPAVDLINNNEMDAAYRLYKQCVLQLQDRFLVSI